MSAKRLLKFSASDADRFSILPLVLLGCLGWTGCVSEVAKTPPPSQGSVSIGTPVIDYLQVGLACSKSHDYAGAISAYTIALEREPTNGAAYGLRGFVEMKTNDLTGAASDYSKAIQLLPNTPSLYENRGKVRARQSDFAGAIADYGRAIQLHPGYFLLYESRGRAEVEMGNLDAAISDLSTAIELNPRSAPSFDVRALAREKKGDLTNALSDLGQEIDLEPNSGRAFNNRCLIETRMGNYAGALLDADQAIRLEPEEPTIYGNRATCEDHIGDLTGAIEDLDQLLALKPNAWTACNMRGVIKMKMANFPGAAEDLARGLQLLGEEGSPHKVYAQLYCHVARLRAGGGDKAWESDRILADTMEAWPKLLVRYMNGNLPEAVLLAHAAEGDPKTSQGQKCEAYYFIGVARLLSGDKAAARGNFEKCLATEKIDFREYDFARAELAMLNGSTAAHGE